MMGFSVDGDGSVAHMEGRRNGKDAAGALPHVEEKHGARDRWRAERIAGLRRPPLRGMPITKRPAHGSRLTDDRGYNTNSSLSSPCSGMPKRPTNGIVGFCARAASTAPTSTETKRKPRR